MIWLQPGRRTSHGADMPRNTIRGTQEWANCPTRYKEQTKAVLLQDVADNIISKDRYKEITGEEYK